jgi:phosphoesterase RecJ-like protein
MQAGAPLAAIMDQAFNRRSYSLLRAWEQALETMQLENGVIWVSLAKQARQQAGLDNTDMQGLGNLMLSVEEACLSAVLVEKDDGQVEVGLRARPSLDVARVALALGGGGHPQAAGCTIDGPLSVAAERVVTLLKSQIANVKNQTD